MAKKSNQDYLEEYLVSFDSKSIKSDNIFVKLPKGKKNYEYVIISELNIGSKDNKPAIKKLLKQIDFISKKDVMVVLGGNLFSYVNDISEVKKYAKVIAGALDPIKEKIILAYDGAEERRSIKAKNSFYPTRYLLKMLQLNENKIYRPNGAVINVISNSANTNNEQVCTRDKFLSIKSTAQTFSAEGNNSFKVAGHPGNYDNIFVTCANNSAIFRKAIMRASSVGNNDKIEKHNFNLILDSGYKLLMKTPGYKIVRYNFIDKFSYVITPSVNRDAGRVVGKDTLTEEPYKAYVSRHVIGSEPVKKSLKSITNMYNSAKNENEFKAKWLCDEIQKKLQMVNSANLDNLLKLKDDIEKNIHESEK